MSTIRIYMDHLGLGYEEVASRADTSSYKVKAWEDGREEMEEVDLLSLAFAFGASTADVMDDLPWDTEIQTTVPDGAGDVDGFAGVASMRFGGGVVRSVPLASSELGYLEGIMFGEHEVGTGGWALLQGFGNTLVAFHPDAVEAIDILPMAEGNAAPVPTAVFEAMALPDRSVLRPRLRGAVEGFMVESGLNSPEAVAARLNDVEVIHRSGTTEIVRPTLESIRPFSMGEFDSQYGVSLDLQNGVRRLMPENRLAALIMPFAAVLRHERHRVNE